MEWNCGVLLLIFENLKLKRSSLQQNPFLAVVVSMFSTKKKIAKIKVNPNNSTICCSLDPDYLI